MITSWNDQAIIARAGQAVNRGLLAAIGIVDQHAVLLITTGAKTGRIYVRRGVKHQASAPGEPPASDTGRLVQAREIRLDADQHRAVLAFHTIYAWWLETGTEKMEPRPFARRALLEKGNEALTVIGTELANEFRKVA